MNSPEHWKLVWDQLRQRGGMIASPQDLQEGDKVAVTGTGQCNGLIKRFAPFTGIVEDAGWQGDRFVFSVRCQEWITLSPTFWANPVAVFDAVTLVDSITRY
jgi:hypothetical protein